MEIAPDQRFLLRSPPALDPALGGDGVGNAFEGFLKGQDC
jgi:hypothetical protein